MNQDLLHLYYHEHEFIFMQSHFHFPVAGKSAPINVCMNSLLKKNCSQQKHNFLQFVLLCAKNVQLFWEIITSAKEAVFTLVGLSV